MMKYLLTLLLAIILYSQNTNAQINFNEVYNNEASYRMELFFNGETNDWSWKTLDHLSQSPSASTMNAKNCDLLMKGLSQAKAEEAIQNTLDRIKEGYCTITILFATEEGKASRSFCLKFKGIENPESIRYIEEELSKNPFGG